MSIRSILARLLAVATASLFLLTLAPTPAAGQSQADVVTQTAWRWRGNAPLSSIDIDINAGYRLVDIEVESVGPLRFSAVSVRNTGDYAKTWWWYYGQTASQVTQRLSQHNARLIDVEPYDTSNGVRYAILLIRNTGSDFSATHGWIPSYSFNQVVNWRNSNPTRRIVDIQPHLVNGLLRYTFAWVQNSGSLYQPWGLYMNTTPSFLSNTLASTNERIVDLEVMDDTERMTVLTAPNDGNAWYWFYGVRSGDVQTTIGQYASRPIDLQRYRTQSGSIRYGFVVRRNENDLTVAATAAQRSYLPISTRSGLLLREFNGATSTMAGTFEGRTFEPASLLKTAHHFAAMRRVWRGLDSLNASVTENMGLNGSCPTGTNPTTRTLRNVVRSMMESSSNTATEAIRARYGTSIIESICDDWGASGVELNHTLGCLCGNTRNEASLLDFAGLHESAVGGALGTARDNFYGLMSNGLDFGRGIFDTEDVLDEELNASGLSSIERTIFRGEILLAHKGGSYNCNAGPERHRSRGAYVRLPHRSGCEIVHREYFIGAWVNDCPTATAADNGVGAAIATLYRDRVRAAIASWESANCDPFVPYCSTVPNSTGQSGLCSATGSAYLLANDLTIHASQLPQDAFGALLVSRQQGFVPNAGGSQGNLCLGGSIGRYFNAIMSSGSSGTMSLDINVNAIPSATGFFAVTSGERLNFQWWHRDLSTSGATSNYTNGLQVSFL
ncbi:MAG: serine hydrolase [Planctomycetota bacterium]